MVAPEGRSAGEGGHAETSSIGPHDFQLMAAGELAIADALDVEPASNIMGAVPTEGG
jgi:hypothetical protein